MNDVVIVKSQGGLGRPLPGEDFISGMIFYTGSLPSGFSSVDRIKQVFSTLDAENLGVVADFSDETKAQGTYTYSAAGAAGDTTEPKVLEWRGSVSLGKYVVKGTDTTATILAASVALNINLGTSTHGYTATSAGAVLTVIARKGTGIFLNSGTPLSVTNVGTVAGSVTTQFTGGVASKLATFHYHISEYFRMQPQGNLWLGFFAIPGTFTGAEIQTMVDFSGVNGGVGTQGKIRQIGVYYIDAAFAVAQLNACQAYATINETNHKPHQVIFGGDISAVSDLSTLSDLGTLSDKNVSLVIGQDGANVGYDYFKAVGKSITNMGACLGTVSKAQVSQDIAEVGAFNISDGNENNVPAFANGVLFNNISTGLQNQLNTYRYIFCRTFVGFPGTFWNDSHCAVVVTSDYAYIENNRTIDKVVRLLRPAYLPFLNSQQDLNSDGTLTNAQVAMLTGVGDSALASMLVPGINGVRELSAQKTIIDPNQNIISTGKLTVFESLLGQAIARGIVLNIGFVKSL